MSQGHRWSKGTSKMYEQGVVDGSETIHSFLSKLFTPNSSVARFPSILNGILKKAFGKNFPCKPVLHLITCFLAGGIHICLPFSSAHSQYTTQLLTMTAYSTVVESRTTLRMFCHLWKCRNTQSRVPTIESQTTPALRRH